MRYRSHVQFKFKPHVSMRDVRDTIDLSKMAGEILHGRERVSLDLQWRLSRKRRCVVIDTHRDAGRTVALIFLGFVRREFGQDAVQIHSFCKPAFVQPAGAAE